MMITSNSSFATTMNSLKHVQGLEEEYGQVIFCGDLNVAHEAIDLARPKENANSIGFLPVERAWVDRVQEAGFVDTFRALHPSTVKYSWWDQKTGSRDRNVGWRIDYFFVNHELFPKVKKSDILTEVMGSDHAPVMLDIDHALKKIPAAAGIFFSASVY
jgi:exodeoxyribonuclease-3